MERLAERAIEFLFWFGVVGAAGVYVVFELGSQVRDAIRSWKESE